METPRSLLNIFNDVTEESLTKIVTIDLSKWIVVTFLYVNFVEGSYINGKLSRKLSMPPLSMKQGWFFMNLMIHYMYLVNFVNHTHKHPHIYSHSHVHIHFINN